MIRPNITQTILKDKKNLKYRWLVSSEDQKEGDVKSTADTLAIVVDTKSKKFQYIYHIRFYVTDTVNNLHAMYPVKLNIRKPYEPAWMILHKDKNTRLAAIEYLAESTLLTLDAYSERHKEHLKGDPVALGVVDHSVEPGGTWNAWQNNSRTVFYCFTTNSNESGILMQDQDLKLDGTMKQYIYSSDYHQWKPSGVVPFFGDHAPLIISGGKAFQGSLSGPLLYGTTLEPGVRGDYFLEDVASVAHDHVVYDSKGNRFFYLSTAYNFYSKRVHNRAEENVSLLSPIPSNIDSPNPEGADVNNLSADKKVVFLERGYWYGKSGISSWKQFSIYGVAISEEKNEIYFYDFHPHAMSGSGSYDGDPQSVTAYVERQKPNEINNSTLFASGSDYNRIIFFATGNRVYKIDFGMQAKNVSLVYQHPNASATVSSIGFASPGNYNIAPDIENKYGHAITRSLGISFNTPDGKGEFVILNLSNSRSIAPDGKYPSVQVFEGFGEIKDAKFI